MKFIAIKTEDGMIKGKLAFYCRMLHVSRQGFYKYLSVKDRPWKYQTLADAMLEIHASVSVIVQNVIRKELRRQIARLVNPMIFSKEISHQKSLLKNA